VTSIDVLGKIRNENEFPIQLGGLMPDDAAKLFVDIAPRPIDMSEFSNTTNYMAHPVLLIGSLLLLFCC
jgi:hypothetical protein